MGRQIFLMRGDTVVWQGIIEATGRGVARTTRECFEEAWEQALREGAVTVDDAGAIQFRSSAPR